MSVTFSPALANEDWAAQPDQLVCLSRDEVIMELSRDWREVLKTREEFENLSRNHCDDCRHYGSTVQRKAPEGYAELNVNNHNAARILLVLGIGETYSHIEGGETFVELSGSISVEKFEQALLIADLSGNPVHRHEELVKVLEAAKRLGCEQIQYA